MQSSAHRDSTHKPSRGDSTHKPSRGKGGGNGSNNSSIKKKAKGSKGVHSDLVHTQSQTGEETYYSDIGKHKDHRDSDKLKLSWTRTESLDFGLLCGQTAAWENTVYFKNGGSDEVLEYSHRSNSWVRLAPPPYRGFALVVLHGLVTAVGGYDIQQHKDSSKLVSLVDGKWVEQYPPMLTARHYAMAVVTSGPKLVVSGGSVGNNVRINTVEVMDVQTAVWQKADNLPLPLSSASFTVCGDDLYLVGGFNTQGEATAVAFTCKISDLLRSTEEKPQKGAHSRLFGLSLWRQITDTPATYTTCTVLSGGHVGTNLGGNGGHLVAVGGLKSSKRPTGDVYRYDPLTNVWDLVGSMPTPRCCTGVASLNCGEMMVVGGTNRQLGNADCANLLEVATF